MITSDSTSLVDESGDAETGDAVTASPDIDSPASVIENTCGFVTFDSLTTVSTLAAAATQSNLGIVCKAESNSTSLYVWGIVNSTTDYVEGRLLLRFGFIKD